MHILHLGCFTTSFINKLPRVSTFSTTTITTTTASLSTIRLFSSFQPSPAASKFPVRTVLKRDMSSGKGDDTKKNFPEVISAAISSLNANVAPFMSTELRKLYGGVPDEDLIKNQVDNYYLPMLSNIYKAT